MKGWLVGIVSAFGRGETLALALHERGFRVKVIDLTPAFSNVYHRGLGPFPVVNKVFMPAQRDLLQALPPLEGGLSIWLKNGPLELNGPMTSVHMQNSPALKAWKEQESHTEFSQAWLNRWLKEWASPVFRESSPELDRSPFPAHEPMKLVPIEMEARCMSFHRRSHPAVEVLATQSLKDIRTENSRIAEIEIESSGTRVIGADQWVWCLSSSETHRIAPEVATRVFWRGIVQPEWCWLNFECTMNRGPWSAGWPNYCVLIGDVYLPWVYSNAAVLRKLDDDRLRIWLKVPYARVEDIDGRRGWAMGIENLLRSHLPQADFKVDSSVWQVCPSSFVYAEETLLHGGGRWKNWDWISPENLPRLDLSARLEREAQSFERLLRWQREQVRKQGGRNDQALHAP